jgi:hypothetical protein
MNADAMGKLLATPLSRATQTGWLTRRKGAA